MAGMLVLSGPVLSDEPFLFRLAIPFRSALCSRFTFWHGFRCTCLRFFKTGVDPALDNHVL